MTDANDDRRSQLVDRLWRLKQVLASQSGRYVHFNMLLNDAAYRQEAIEYALSSDDAGVRDLAHQAYQLNMGGQLLNPPGAAARSDQRLPAFEGKAQPERPSQIGEVKPTGYPLSETRSSSSRWYIVALMLLLVLGGAIGFVWMQGGALGIGGTKVVRGVILEDTTWKANTVYRLDGLVYVNSGVRLMIEAGTRILGEQGSALIVTREASIYARGSKEQPIVFTSAQPVGARQRGDWGGLVLLGNAPLNRGSAHIEGIPPEEPFGNFGGTDPRSNCGMLEYVRIEFAGFEIGANNELNGLTLGGCGTDTIIRYVQSHKGKDDGIEVFGGTVDLHHIVVTGAADDSFDWDMGWRGRVQFLVVQQHPDKADNGFEGDNWKSEPNGKPRSAPTFYNVTMIGSPREGGDERGMLLRRGSGGIFRNFIIMGFPYEVVNLVGVDTASLLKSGELDFRSMMFYLIGRTGRQFFADERDDDGGLMEAELFAQPERGIRMGDNPGLRELAYRPLDPGFSAAAFTPAADSPALQGAARLPTAGGTSASEFEFWHEAAAYLGAVRPGVIRNWLEGWTAFPVN